MDILQKIFDNKPEIKEQYNYLYSYYKNSFERKEKDKDQINRVSFVSEIRFGYYLHNRFENLEYDPNVSGKTPDWVVDSNFEKIIFEVKQLNPNNNIFEERINQVKADKYYGEGKLKGVYGIGDIFPYLTKIMEKEKIYRDLILDGRYKLVICINFSNLLDEFFTDNDLIDYLDLKNNYNFFRHTIEYLDINNFNNFCNNVSGFLVIPRFGSDIFFIENKMSANKLSSETIEKLNKTFLISK
ncbi:hypothetical protein ACPDHJ_05925 [Myroides sp. C8-3]|uniref:hypothetical protein n=1 Tax=Myroides sp. C8-3 TaxID=3400533 RepID=UPI003D2F7C4A